MKDNKEILEIKKKAAEYQAKGLYREALKELEKLLEHPGAVDESVYQRIGELHKKLGNKEKALENYMKAVEGYKKHGSYSHLIPLYKRIMELDPGRKELLVDLAEAYYQRNMITESAKALYEYASYLYQKGDIDRAFMYYEKVIELTPENILLQREIAELYLLHNRVREAYKIYKKIFNHYKKLGREDKLVEIREKLEEIEIVMGEEGVEIEEEMEEKKFDKEDEEEKDFLTVDDLLSGKRTGFRKIVEEEAVPSEERGEVAPPEEEEMKIERGEIEEAGEKVEEESSSAQEKESESVEAEEEKTEVKIVSKGWEAVVDMGDVYWELGEKEDALKEYYTAADGYYKEHDFMKALKVYKKISDYYPFELKARQRMVQIAQQIKDKNLLVEALLELANCLYERGDKQKAKVWYLQILKRADPNCKEARERLSVIAPELLEKIDKERKKEKKVKFPPKKEKVKEPAAKKEPEPKEEVAIEEPEFIDLGEEIRKELEKEEKPVPQTKEEKEKEIFEQIKESIYTYAEKVDPVDLLEVGMAMKELGLLDDAISNLKKALSGDEKIQKEAYHLLGQIFIEMGKFDIAIENLENALKIKTEDEEKERAIYYDLAKAYENMREWSKAVRYYKMLYEKEPSSKELKQKIIELAKKIKLSTKKGKEK